MAGESFRLRDPTSATSSAPPASASRGRRGTRTLPLTLNGQTMRPQEARGRVGASPSSKPRSRPSTPRVRPSTPRVRPSTPRVRPSTTSRSAGRGYRPLGGPGAATPRGYRRSLPWSHPHGSRATTGTRSANFPRPAWAVRPAPVRTTCADHCATDSTSGRPHDARSGTAGSPRRSTIAPPRASRSTSPPMTSSLNSPPGTRTPPPPNRCRALRSGGGGRTRPCAVSSCRNAQRRCQLAQADRARMTPPYAYMVWWKHAENLSRTERRHE